MPVPAGVTLRPMTLDDVEAGLRLCRAARWNQVARDWEQFLVTQPGGALVACRGSRVVGSVATIRYAPDLAWVAMVLVDPDERGRGIGRALLDGGLALVADVPCVGLDATPLGRPLYLSLGFADAEPLTRLQRTGASPHSDVADTATTPLPAAAVPATTVTVHPLTTSDHADASALDRDALGVDRSSMLAWLAQGAPGYAWVARDHASGALVGYTCGRHGHDFEHIGPVIAASDAAAGALVSAALALVPPQRPVVVDAAEERAAFVTGLEARGFARQRPFTRMYRGRPRPAPPRQFAIIGPEFG